METLVLGTFWPDWCPRPVGKIFQGICCLGVIFTASLKPKKNNIPLAHTPGIPKPPNERNSFINRWLGVWGMFQGYVGKFLDNTSLLQINGLEDDLSFGARLGLFLRLANCVGCPGTEVL